MHHQETPRHTKRETLKENCKHSIKNIDFNKVKLHNFHSRGCQKILNNHVKSYDQALSYTH